MEAPDNPRDRIIAEAKNMFFSFGYSKVLMAELAKRLGMSKKTLYQYFTSKEELLSVVIRNHGQEIQREVEHRLAQHASVTEHQRDEERRIKISILGLLVCNFTIMKNTPLRHPGFTCFNVP